MRHCRRSHFLGFNVSTLILANAAVGLLVITFGSPSLAAQAMLKKDSALKPNPRIEPGYELTPGARDPFQPSVIIAGATSEDNSLEVSKSADAECPSENTSPPSSAEVAAGIHLQAVFSQKGDNWGIFNGQPAKKGDTVTCKIRGIACSLIVIKIELTPPSSVLRFGDTEFSCDLQSTTPQIIKK